MTKLNEACALKDHQQISRLHCELTNSLESKNLSQMLLQFETERMNNYQMRMISIYMRMFERLLLFIHATRSQNWSLHLSAAEDLIPDLLSTDRIKYGRLLPVYLAEMYSLETSDPVVWEAFSNGEFAVQKTKIPFVALGMDHAGEQVNKLLKINGGLIGVSKNVNARNRFMITAPIISGISTEAKKVCGIHKEKSEHHQLSNAYLNLQHDMITKFVKIFQSLAAVPGNGRKVAIIDAMVVVQKIAALEKNKQIEIRSCKDVANHFIRRVLRQIEGFQEVRVVLDCYEDLSLKQFTREHRGNSMLSHFVVSDKTPVDTTLQKF